MEVAPLGEVIKFYRSGDGCPAILHPSKASIAPRLPLPSLFVEVGLRSPWGDTTPPQDFAFLLTGEAATA